VVVFSDRYALMSRRLQVYGSMQSRAFNKKFLLKFFTTVHGDNLIGNHFIVLDEGANNWNVEKYLTRDNADRAFLDGELKSQILQSNATQYASLFTSGGMEYKEGERTAFVRRLEKHSLVYQSFPDLKDLYDELNFPKLAQEAEDLLEKPNQELAAWKRHLRDEGGFSVVRVKDPHFRENVVIPCVLLPSTAVDDWKGVDFVKNTDQLLQQLWEMYPPESLQRYYDNPKEMNKLFYYKSRGKTFRKEKFSNVPLWKLEVMLKKWRTDKALVDWAKEHKSVMGQRQSQGSLE
jgi:hypothetical protein